MNQVIQFDASVSNIQKVNPLFSKCDIKVLYTGSNKNNSFISKDTVEKALPTIYNIPIVGEFKEVINDFGSHGGKVEISEEGIKFIQTTKPYGVVPESANIFWQPIAEDDGVVREYLIVEGAYLWTGRYAEAAEVVNSKKGQSMEIEVLDGTFNQQNLFVINDMVFSALCILGNEVMPCFESASINAYSMNKDDFKQEFFTMLKELKASLSLDDAQNKSKEGESMQDEQELASFTKEHPGLTQEEVDAERKQDGYKADGDAEDKKDGGVDDAEEDAKGNKKQKMAAKDDGDLEDKQDGGAEKAPSAYEAEKSNFLAQIESLKSDISNLNAELQKVSAERDELFAFKKETVKEFHKAKVEELFEQFDKLDEEDFAQVREVMFDLTLEQVEEKLFFMLGKKLAKYSANTKKKETVKVEFNLADKQEKKDGYELSYMFEKYSDN